LESKKLKGKRQNCGIRLTANGCCLGRQRAPMMAKNKYRFFCEKRHFSLTKRLLAVKFLAIVTQKRED